MGDNGFHEWHKPQTLAQGSEQPEIKVMYDYQLNEWRAWDEPTYDGPGSCVAYADTKAEAIADLKQQLIERGLYANIE